MTEATAKRMRGLVQSGVINPLAGDMMSDVASQISSWAVDKAAQVLAATRSARVIELEGVYGVAAGDISDEEELESYTKLMKNNDQQYDFADQQPD